MWICIHWIEFSNNRNMWNWCQQFLALSLLTEDFAVVSPDFSRIDFLNILDFLSAHSSRVVSTVSSRNGMNTNKAAPGRNNWWRTISIKHLSSSWLGWHLGTLLAACVNIKYLCCLFLCKQLSSHVFFSYTILSFKAFCTINDTAKKLDFGF